MSAYRADIDGLRAVAVLAVVLYHAGVPGLSGGFVGVDVFFVISGFLITGILAGELEAGRFSLIGFYERRARRILPALAVVLAAAFAAGWALLSPDALRDMAGSAAATAVFASNLWFWRTLGYFAPAAEFQPLLHTWSLAVEEQFYILFPLLLYALRRVSRRALVGVMAAACAGSFLLAVVAVARSPTAAFYLLPTRAWELGVGALLAVAPMPVRSRRLREGVAAAGLAAILGAVALIDASTPFPGAAALPPCLGAAALIWAGAQGPTRTGALLSTRPMVLVGLISYSLYLWHWPILAFLRVRFGMVDLPGPVAAGAVAAAFVAAALSWRFVERPFRVRPPRGFGRGAIFAAAAASIAAAALAGGLLWRDGGAPGRYPPAVLAAFEAADETAQNPDRRLCVNRPPTRGLCRFGSGATEVADGPADFLLWGDSQALAVMPAAAVAAEASGREGMIASKSACAPLLGLDRLDMGPRHDCSGFNAAVLALLRARDDMPLVILAARWALNAEGVRPEGEPGAAARLAAPGAAPPRTREENFARFQAAVAPTVAAIRATGREVAILGALPEIGWDVPSVVARSLDAGVALPPLPGIDAVLARQGRSDAALAGEAAAEGVRFHSLAERTCDPGCRVAVDGLPLYRDNHHLSRFGAMTIALPIFATELARPQARLPGGRT